jgi:quercetin dioxygenase-like cupin family protein
MAAELFQIEDFTWKIECRLHKSAKQDLSMSDFTRVVGTVARFDSSKATKADLFSGNHLFLGLNCFEPGQSQRIHAHDDADKFYFLVSGKARMAVGEETCDVSAGTVVWAPAGMPHGVVEAIERTVMLVGMAGPQGSGAAGR